MKYTKRQILEALRYWNGLLRRMDEKTISIVDGGELPDTQTIEGKTYTLKQYVDEVMKYPFLIEDRWQARQMCDMYYDMKTPPKKAAEIMADMLLAGDDYDPDDYRFQGK